MKKVPALVLLLMLTLSLSSATSAYATDVLFWFNAWDIDELQDVDGLIFNLVLTDGVDQVGPAVQFSYAGSGALYWAYVPQAFFLLGQRYANATNWEIHLIDDQGWNLVNGADGFDQGAINLGGDNVSAPEDWLFEW